MDADRAAFLARQARAPFFDSLLQTRARRPVSFHMPGHKFNPALTLELAEFFGAGLLAGDLNECLPSVDYLHGARAALAEAQALAAEAVGAGQTFFLVNGSTAGNQAMLLAAAGEDQPILVPRAAHRSVYAGLVLSGARPIYLAPRYHPEIGFPLAVTADDVAHHLAAAPAAVQLTSPSYYGFLPDVAAVAALAHTRGLPLLVDEAHGAHLPFHPALPRSAVTHGADLVVQSAHKTLAALTQAAWLHRTGERIPLPHLQAILALLQSSSPSVLLTASLDVARRQAVLHGRRLLDRALNLAEAARAAIRRLPRLWCYGPELVGAHGVAAYDPTKLVIRVTDAGLTGVQFAAELWARFNLSVEFSDPQHLICSVTMADDQGRVDFLIASLTAVMQAHAALPPLTAAPLTPPPALPPVVLNPRPAARHAAQAVPLAAAAGAVCAEPVIPYPPGIPVLMPGELITPGMLDYLRYLRTQQLTLVGPADPRLDTLRVLRA